MSFVKRLVQFDVDSTFIEQEAIELLAQHGGVYEEVAQVTEAAMRGELDFVESLIARVALLKGLPEGVIEQVQQEIRVTDGAADLVVKLHQLGHCVSLVSGGFINILAPLAAAHKIDYVRANMLEIADGRLTGRVAGPIIDRAAKAAALIEFAEHCGVAITETVAIGDGANDLDMMKLAGISIAFNAKPVVAKIADFSITEPSLKGVIELLKL